MRRNLPKNTPGENESIKGIMKNEVQRYKEKGLTSTMTGIGIFCVYFYVCPLILKEIWPYMISLGSQKILMSLLIVTVPFLMLIVGNLFFWILYVGKFSFFEQYRITEQPWPWEKDSKQWRQFLYKSFKRILVNTFLIQLPITFLVVFSLGLDKSKWTMEEFPTHFEMVTHFFFMLIVEDFATYNGHRLMHEPFFYKRFHKIHHEYIATISIAATYAHPVEFILTNSTPAILGYVFLGSKVHFVSFIMWIIMRMVDTIEIHSGYEIHWSPLKAMPFSCSSEYHSYHHSHNLGTFGSFFNVWDTLFKTNNDFFLFKAKQETKDEKLTSTKKSS